MDLATTELAVDGVETINTGERAGFDTRKHLEHAARQARERNYADFLIVDADAHHRELHSWSGIVKYFEDPTLRQRAEYGIRTVLSGQEANQHVSGRITEQFRFQQEPPEQDLHLDITRARRQMESIGIDYQILFPTHLLSLGLHPDPSMEVALNWAYSRWLTEELLPQEPRLKTLISLPFNEPAAALRSIERFADHPSVAGFMVTSTRYRPVHHNAYMPVYRAIEEREMPIVFHAVFNQRERLFEAMNKFLSVHALGFVLNNMVHMINLVINGIPERFPKLKIVWMENGLAWLPFMMERLDNEYLMRTSEAPLLKKLPSDYMRDMYYTAQPIENKNLEWLELTMKMMNAETQLMFASDFPHWDFNLPSTIYDLPFLSEKAKRRILGENARGVFKLGI